MRVTGFHASKRLENLCPESCLLIVIGIALGIITYFSSDQNEIIEFDTQLFFTVILPPIIMEAGYFMPTRAFFDQLGTILLHAIVATLVCHQANSGAESIYNHRITTYLG